MLGYNFIVGGCVVISVLLTNQSNCDALIIPDEVPTLLSLIYSNIPTLKKGTDSRLGWGFRLGDRADFQFLVELGPQKDTLPLGNQGDNANKRQALNSLANTLYAQSIRNKQNQEKEASKVLEHNPPNAEFIQQWSESLKLDHNRPIEGTEEPTKFTLGIGEVDAKDYIPADETSIIKVPKSTTSHKDALDNVDFD